ncbi:MAG: hypothetical protein E6Q99_01720 [Elusimicrobia bacterium]|nr:MAG: hypothetical protein E6Q99_01720 [Elusimicrobiota bacterium]
MSTLAWAFYQWRAGGLRRLAADAWARVRERWGGEPGDGFLRALLVAVFVLNGLMCFVPEVFYDALVYHLGVPRWYLLEGGLRYYPAYHAQFPFTRQMINLFGLALQGDTLAKLLHFATSVQILGTFLAMAERFGRRRVGLLASLIFLSVPMVAMNLWTTGVDVALTAVSLLALGAGLISLTAPAPRPWVVLSGLFLGLTVSTKYPGGVDAAVWGGVFFFHRAFVEKNPRAAFRDLAILVGVAFLVFLPWLVKNAVLTGNPVYPYLHGLFGGRDLLPDKLAIFNADIAQGAARDPIALLSAPWRLTFTLTGSASAPGLFPLALLGAMIWGFARRQDRPAFVRPLAVYVVLYLAVMFVLTSQTRYAISGLAAHAFLIGEAIDALGRAAGAFVRWGLTATVFVAALAGLDMSFFTATRAYAPWSLLTGGESRRAYQYYSHLGLNPGPANEGYDYLQEKRSGAARVLILGDEKVFPCAVPFRASGVFNEQLITRWAREAGSPEKLWETLTEREKITHFLINLPSNFRLMPYNQYAWDPRSLGVACALWDRHVRLIHRAAAPEKIDPRFLNETLVYVLAPADALPGVPPPDNALLLVEEERVGPWGSPGWREKRLALLDAVLSAGGPIPSVQKRRQALLSALSEKKP